MRLQSRRVLFWGAALTMALGLGNLGNYAQADSPDEIVAKDGIIFRKSEKSGFYTVISPSGRKAPDLVDELFVKFYTSPESNPNQKGLDALLANVDQVRLYDCGLNGDSLMDGKKVLDVSKAEDLALFRQQLKISEDERTFGHCMCLGGPTIELLQDKKHLAYIACQHGHGIRWKKWKWDAQLIDGKALASWFAAHGYDKQLKSIEEQEKAQALAKKNCEKWLAALPPSLPLDSLKRFLAGKAGWVTFGGRNERSFEGTVLSKEKADLKNLLDKGTGDREKSVLQLLRWAGNGVPEWEGSPSYEEFVFELLDAYSMRDFYQALRVSGLDGEVLEGACHYACRLPRSLTAGFPLDVKKLLLRHVEQAKDQEKIRSLQKALGKI